MEIQKVKDWKINKGKQFELITEVVPNKIIYSSSVEFVTYALRLKDNVKFFNKEQVKFKTKQLIDRDCIFNISCFHKDGIHVDIKKIFTFTKEINDIIKL